MPRVVSGSLRIRFFGSGFVSTADILLKPVLHSHGVDDKGNIY